MLFANRLKGAVTQVLLRTLLHDGGYRIVPLGIEEVIRELTVLTAADYVALKLPTLLRCLPDFFVAQEDMKQTWLVEVKYRKEWNQAISEALAKQLLPQVSAWAPLYLMVFLGNAAKADTDLPSSWMGVLRLAVEDGQLVATNKDGTPYAKWSEITWKHFFRVQDFFPSLSAKEKWEQQTLQQIRVLLPQLATLDVFK